MVYFYSALDIAWQFSSLAHREAHPTHIEFPIFEVPPVEKNDIAAYRRRVKGISDPGAAILIEWFQPYNAPNPINSPLLIVHKMDITDKHRELVMTVSTGVIPVSTELVERFMRYQRGEPGVAPVDFGAEFKRDPRIYPNVSFKQFGGREIEPVIQGLAFLHNFVVKVVEKFDTLAKYVDPLRHRRAISHCLH